MTDNQKHNKLIQRIVESKAFGKSGTYENLLKYLVNSTVDKNIPKETTIAHEIFGKGDSKEDTGKVRVYIYHLRKKLQKYYGEEGKHEDLILTIPKGGYRVKFSKRPNEKITTINKKTAIIISSIIIAITIVVLVFNFLIFQKSVPSFWKSIFQSDHQTTFVLGDLFIYEESDSALGFTRTIRDPNLNSLQEFYAFKDSLNEPHRSLDELTYSFLIRSSATWIKNMTELFLSYNSDFNIRLMSQLDPKDLQDHNIVYAGMIKNSGFFKNYFNNSRFQYDSDKEVLIYEDSLGNITSYGPSGDPDNYHTDYGLIAKFPGPNNNEVILLTGIWDTGASQSVKNLTDSQLMKRFESQLQQKLNYVPDYFELLFEVNGIDRTELNTTLIHGYEIKNGSRMWDVQ
ncbi:helix-turn-helix domain-containing protein [Membranihabitans maritimus]|uniref:helix-turn-helix domain-containing protein n=1 Tax=Membranihabitans maritimus TaxID=2904244 RepID=UPI001F46910C|nr:helix-turn-helix domain-containing protein [Membranihabitans maritimus]